MTEQNNSVQIPATAYQNVMLANSLTCCLTDCSRIDRSTFITNLVKIFHTEYARQPHVVINGKSITFITWTKYYIISVDLLFESEGGWNTTWRLKRVLRVRKYSIYITIQTHCVEFCSMSYFNFTIKNINLEVISKTMLKQ